MPRTHHGIGATQIERQVWRAIVEPQHSGDKTFLRIEDRTRLG